MMNKNTIILLVFLGGIVCGYILNSMLDMSPQTAKANQSNEKTHDAATPENPEQPQNGFVDSAMVLEHVLPNSSPLWAHIDLEKFRLHKESFSDLLEKDSVMNVFNEFVASLPQGVTPTISTLCGDSNEIRIFLMPSAGSDETPCYVAAFHQLAPTTVNNGTPFVHSLLADFPDAVTSQQTVGALSLETITLPFAEITYAKDQDTLWISNQKEAFSQLWSSPPPPELAEKPGPHADILRDYADTAVALFMNAAHEGPALIAPVGIIPAFLSDSGVKRIVCLYRLLEDASFLTMIAPVETPLPWMAEWEPVDRYPFTNADPAGLIEMAFRYPLMDVPESATAAIQSATNNDQNDTPPQSMHPSFAVESENRELEGMPVSTSLDRPRGERRAGRPRNGENRRDDRTSQEMQRRRDGRGARLPQLAQFGFLSTMIPKGQITGVNFFGFYDGVPTLTLAFPECEIDNPFTQMLVNMPFVKTDEVEIAKIPATAYRFDDSPLTQVAKLHELLVVERDATTYIFDSVEAAKNYFGEENTDPAGKERRDKDIRLLRDHVRQPAQVEITFSKDLFLQILEMEQFRIEDEFLQEEISALFDEIRPLLQPMALSAGFSEQEWFAETYSASQIAHLLDSLLLGFATYRTLGF
ncbi:MAG: hypothetical protein C4527_26340 [Candidatus Omnitrophota bacterium]|jgi:hypothetical protein|nr:MAG: hypothetical protein C4527_26340 [Candidatus Omnitrophota bacterium]